MVSVWNKNGNLMKYIEQQPGLDRYELVRPIIFLAYTLLCLRLPQCVQVVSAVVYLHKSDVVSASYNKILNLLFLYFTYFKVHGDLKGVRVATNFMFDPSPYCLRVLGKYPRIGRWHTAADRFRPNNYARCNGSVLEECRPRLWWWDASMDGKN